MGRERDRGQGGSGSRGRAQHHAQKRRNRASSGGRARQPTRYRDAMPKNRRDQPIVLSHIYTRTGDDGTTALGDMSRVPKTDPRLVAYADVDEANCAIGTALVMTDGFSEPTDSITRSSSHIIPKDHEQRGKREFSCRLASFF